MYRAAFITNLPILNLIYSKDPHINEVSYDTPLFNAFTQVMSYTLIHDSDWGSVENKKKMAQWYEGRGAALPGELGYISKI